MRGKGKVLCKVRKLRDDEIRQKFQDKVKVGLEGRSDSGVEGRWQCMKDYFLTVADEVCGRTKRPRKRKETWWWNEEVGKAIEITKGNCSKFGKTPMLKQIN